MKLLLPTLTPAERAKDLLYKFNKISTALSFVDEIIKIMTLECKNISDIHDYIIYYNQVKNELTNLSKTSTHGT